MTGLLQPRFLQNAGDSGQITNETFYGLTCVVADSTSESVLQSSSPDSQQASPARQGVVGLAGRPPRKS